MTEDNKGCMPPPPWELVKIAELTKQLKEARAEIERLQEELDEIDTGATTMIVCKECKEPRRPRFVKDGLCQSCLIKRVKAALRYALRFIGYASCHGYKCRLPHCHDCNCEDAIEQPDLDKLNTIVGDTP